MTAPSGVLAAVRHATHAGYTPDPAQEHVATLLDETAAALAAARPRFWQRARRVPGLYLWGGVGRGKTWLMDLFYRQLAPLPARRWHFHAFMMHLHQALNDLPPGIAGRLAQAVKNLTGPARVLCLDEFFVADIGDAMLLTGVLETLYERRVTLVTTSNIAPPDLYRDGLQRARFLPAIALLERHNRIVHVAPGADYRLALLDRLPAWHVPHNAAADGALERCFVQLAGSAADRQPIEINGRPLMARAAAGGVVWFDFAELGETARSAADYVELARQYHTLLLGGIPPLGEHNADPARRFIDLIDALYDHRVKLLATAATEPDRLYTGRRLAAAWPRTASRLHEMQTHHWHGTAHRG